MSKVTKNKRIKELERQVKGLTVLFSSLNTWSNYADDMLTELNHALPDPEYDAKCEAAVAGVEASLDRHRERLGLNKPQLKQLDQSAFDHPYVTDIFKYVALNADGQAVFFESKPVISNCLDVWVVHTGSLMPMLKGYDTSDWQNSLIERDIAKELLEVDLSSELTGSELCKAMLARGDKYVMCGVSDDGEEDTLLDGCYVAVSSIGVWGVFETYDHNWLHATPINNQGEPLTASEVGL